jgi:C-methyltransferase C-terminal domain/Putative zinc binding domain/Methyltransferase domain
MAVLSATGGGAMDVASGVVDARRGGWNCRFCGAQLSTTVVDLGLSPPCESFVPADRLDSMEPFYPLHVRVCERCFLVQMPEFVTPAELFTEYAYFSAYSDSWVAHAAQYAESMIERRRLGPSSFVVELASNDGYLLQHFLPHGVPVLGIDPARNVADAAIARGVPTLVDFFGEALARRLVDERGTADLVIGNNVLAQVPDLNDFVAGVAILLAPEGVATFEFPHLAKLLQELQYDTIYHEHFSYFSLATIAEVLQKHGIAVTDVDELPTHGGSLRVHAMLVETADSPTEAVARVLAAEEAGGLRELATYETFAVGVVESKRRLLGLLCALRGDGLSIGGYGAPGKGNTLLNYCGIRTDFLDYTVDRNPYKHGLYTPGTHIPIHPTERLAETRPDYILVLAWNLIDEISSQLAYVAEWGAHLIVPIPYATTIEPGAKARERLETLRRAP